MIDTNYILCFFPPHWVQLWADSLSVPYSAQTVKILGWKVVCSQYFSDIDF